MPNNQDLLFCRLNETKDQTEKYLKLNDEVGGDLQPLCLDDDIDEKLNDDL